MNDIGKDLYTLLEEWELFELYPTISSMGFSHTFLLFLISNEQSSIIRGNCTEAYLYSRYKYHFESFICILRDSNVVLLKVSPSWSTLPG